MVRLFFAVDIRFVGKVMFIACTVALLLSVMSAEIRRETLRTQADLQATLTKMCPMIWEHLEKVGAMPQGADTLKWCPEA